MHAVSLRCAALLAGTGAWRAARVCRRAWARRSWAVGSARVGTAGSRYVDLPLSLGRLASIQPPQHREPAEGKALRIT
eukprot:4389156-Pleurochrysis_carterae.AAC.4